MIRDNPIISPKELTNKRRNKTGNSRSFKKIQIITKMQPHDRLFFYMACTNFYIYDGLIN